MRPRGGGLVKVEVKLRVRVRVRVRVKVNVKVEEGALCWESARTKAARRRMALELGLAGQRQCRRLCSWPSEGMGEMEGGEDNECARE